MAPNTQTELPVLRESAAVEELKARSEAAATQNPVVSAPRVAPELEAARKKDEEERKKTGRAKGWYDYEVCFCTPYYAKIYPSLVSEDLVPLISERFHYNDELDLWNEVPSPNTPEDTSSTSVVRITSPPPSFSRMPNRWAYDKVMKLSDAVVLFPSDWRSPAEALNHLRISLQREFKSYSPWELAGTEPMPVMPSKLKPVVFLLPTNTHEAMDSYENVIRPFAEKRRKEILELQQQGEDVLFIEADFSNRRELQNALVQILDYIRSNRGIAPAKPIPPPSSRKFSRMSSKKKKKTSTTPKTGSRWFNWLPSFFSSRTNNNTTPV